MQRRFAITASTVLDGLAEAVPFSLWAVSRRSGADWVVLAARDTEYGVLVGDVLPWDATPCARMVEGVAPEATGDVREVPAYAATVDALGMAIGAFVSVPLRSSTGELFGTLCGADPERRDGPMTAVLTHAQRAASVLSVLIEQELQLDRADRSSRQWRNAAAQDGLTGVGNRRYWEDALEAAEASCASVGSRAGVLVVKVGGAACLGDGSAGPPGEDLVLATGHVLLEQLRQGDVLARTHGDEFAILLVEATQEMGYGITQRLREVLGDGVSIGMSLRTSSGRTLRQAWDQARSAAVGAPSWVRPTAAPDGERLVTDVEATSFVVTAASAAVRDFVPGDDVEALLRAAREALDLPVAFLSRFCGSELLIQAVDSDHPVALHAGDRQAAEHTYCQLVVDGRIPQAVPDTSANAETATLLATTALGIGSYVGVPVLLPDGSVYGSLCAYGEQARDVDARDSAVLALVARTMGQQLGPALQRWQQEQSVRRRVREVIDGALITTVYQPVVDTRTGRAVAVEALSRFPAGYERRPDQWFADAVEVGECAALELAAAQGALSGLADLPAHLQLSVNVSPDVAMSPEFRRWLTEVPLDRLVLELTEHAQVPDYDALLRALAPARKRGLRLAVDDAGAGYASMRHMLMLRPDLIKLDISLVRDVDTDRSRRALCAAVVEFAHQTGAQIVAEGVETLDELRTLRLLGADYVQGYLLQRPSAAADLVLADYPALAEREAEPGLAGVAGLTGLIAEMSLAGHSAATIAARLNRLGWRRAEGVRWSRASVARQLLPEAEPDPACMLPDRAGLAPTAG